MVRRTPKPGRIAWAIAVVDVVAILIVSLVDPDLDGATALLYATVRRALAPSSAGLWLRGRAR